MTDIVHDLRIALRGLQKTPGFMVVATRANPFVFTGRILNSSGLE